MSLRINSEPLDGEVAYINHCASDRSSYGKYIVIIHPKVDPPIYTLYAHLSSIDKFLKVGKTVKGGDVIGVMGRTDLGNDIPKERTHLHFEMGVMLSNQFPQWYAAQKFDSPNRHGVWNGQNLTGFDPLDFYEKWRSGKISSVKEYFNQIPIAFTLRILNTKIPNFLQRYPSLVTKNVEKNNIMAWDIDFTWFAMPIRWTPLYTVDKKNKTKTILVTAYNNNVLNEHKYKDCLFIKKDKTQEFGKVLKKTLDLLFDY